MPFHKGQSGNPGGRPKESAEIKELARAHSEEAFNRLIHWMRTDEAKASLSATLAVIERAFGKVPQAIGGSDELPPVKVEYTDEQRLKAAQVVIDQLKRKE